MRYVVVKPNSFQLETLYFVVTLIVNYSEITEGRGIINAFSRLYHVSFTWVEPVVGLVITGG